MEDSAAEMDGAWILYGFLWKFERFYPHVQIGATNMWISPW
jgi:hypothetical protein